MLSAEHSSRQSGISLRWWASGTAMVAALGVVGIARWLGNDLEVDTRGQLMAVPLGAVVFATLIGVGAAQALRVISNRTARPRRTYWLLAGLGLLGSSGPPLVAATDPATSAWLLLAHATVATVLLPTFSPDASVRRASTGPDAPS